MIWVAKSGPDPRAWCRPNSKQHSSSKSGWIPRRVQDDRFLIHPDHLKKTIDQWKYDIIENRRLRCSGDDPEHRSHPQTNSYLSIQSELLQQILKARKLLRWLRYFPENSLNFTYNRRLRNRRWHLLNLWLRVPNSHEIFNDCPALAVVMASCWVFRGKRDSHQFRAMRALTKGPRRKLLQWLRFPDSPSMIKLLRNLDHLNMTCIDLIWLRDLTVKRPDIRSWLLEYDTPIKRKHLAFLRTFVRVQVTESHHTLSTPSLALFRQYMQTEAP